MGAASLADDHKLIHTTPFIVTSFNVNGLRSPAKMDLLHTHVLLIAPDVLFIQESRLDSSVIANLIIPNYNLFRRDRNGIGGGLATYIKSSLSPSLVTINACNLDNIEFLAVSLTVNSHTFAFCNSYKPPKTPDSDYIDNLISTLAIIKPSFDYIFVGGDLNLCHKHPESLPLINGLTAFDLTQVVKFITHIKRIIDVLYIPDEFVSSHTVKALSPIEKFHAGVYCKFNLPRPTINSIKSYRTFYLYEKADWPKINRHLLSLQINRYFYNFESSLAVELLQNAITTTRDLFVPKKVFCVRANSPKWLTHELLSMAADKDNAYRKYLGLKIKNPQLSTKYFVTYKRLFNKFRKLAAKCRKDFLNNKLSHVTNSSDFWRTVNDVLKPKLQLPNTVIDISGRFANTPHDISCAFSDYFASQLNSHQVPVPDASLLPTEFVFPNCTELFIRVCIAKIKPHCSPGHDNISSLMLKRCIEVFAPVLCIMVNEVCSSQIFPKSWKLAVLAVLAKIPNADRVNDFRPISILSLLSKFVEWFVLDVLKTHTSHLLSDSQFGFRSNRGTVDCVYNVLQQSYNLLSTNPHVALVSLDVAKAFDKVVHNTLLTILIKINIPLPIYNIIKSFLSNRTQFVRYGDATSPIINVSSGVPQGSILGPYLFILYINHIFTLSNNPHISIFGYADDVLIVAPLFDVSSRDNLNNTIHNIVYYLNTELSLSVNNSKSQFLLINRPGAKARLVRPVQITRSNSSSPLLVSVKDADICQVQHLKYLGVFFDSNIDFNYHFTIKCSLVKRHLAAAIRSFRKCISFESKRLLYTALLRCHLLYAVEAIYPRNIVDRTLIEQIQKYACRYITNRWCSSIPYHELLTHCNLPPIYQLVCSMRLHLIHSYVTNSRFCPNSLTQPRPQLISKRVGVRAHRLQIADPPNTKQYEFIRMSPHHSIVRAYNLIEPFDIIHLPSSQFKKLIFDKHFITNFIDDNTSPISVFKYNTYITSIIHLPVHSPKPKPVVNRYRCPSYCCFNIDY